MGFLAYGHSWVLSDAGAPHREGTRGVHAHDLAFSGEGALPILVSPRMAHQLWPGEAPLGRTVTLRAGQDDTPEEVGGVVEDMRERGIDEGPTLAVYMPYLNNRFGPDLVVHTAGDPMALLPALRAAVADLDPDLPLSGITTWRRWWADPWGASGSSWSW